jgi:hypothetical protein
MVFPMHFDDMCRKKPQNQAICSLFPVSDLKAQRYGQPLPAEITET